MRKGIKIRSDAIIVGVLRTIALLRTPRCTSSCPTPLATEKNSRISCTAWKSAPSSASMYHVRNEESAPDIVQDSMMRLAEHYGDKPANELPMLFQRILSNCTLDWFRRQRRTMRCSRT